MRGTPVISPNLGVTGEVQDPDTVNAISIIDQQGSEFQSLVMRGARADELRAFLSRIEEEDVA